MGDLKLPVLGDPNFDEDFRYFCTEVRERNTRLHQDALHKYYENVLFNYNLHWITFDNVTQTWRPKAMKPWVPKPSTNKYAAVLRPIVSVLCGTDPVLQYAPCSDDPADVATAQVASRIIEIAREETKISLLRPKIARWVALTGNVWLISGYDNDMRYGMVPEQAQQCVSCGKSIMADDIQQEGGCPTCNEAGNQSQGFMPAMDPYGNPVMGQRPRGALFTEMATPFEMEYDHEASDFNDSLYALRIRTRDKAWAKERFGLSDEELRGSLASTALSSIVQQRYLESLAFVSPLSYQLYFSRPHRENRVLTTELWINPTVENPGGVYGILVGNDVVFKGPYKYHAADSKPGTQQAMRPVVHFGYEIAPGRLAYRTPADDLVPKQRTRNELESIWKLHSRRAANSVIWIPDGANVSKLQGEEGLVIRYTAMSGVAPPHREQGLESPRFIADWIKLIDMEMEDMAGVSDILRGEAPAGLESYAALQALETKAMQSLSEPKTMWANGWAQWSKQILGIFKEYCVDDRDFSMISENGQWAVQKFSNADMRGALHIIPDLQNLGPSSPVARSARLEQAERMMLFNPQDPQERMKALEIIGLPELMADFKADKQQAAQENDAFHGIFAQNAPGSPPPANALVDNHMVHLGTHRKFALSDKFKQIPPLGKAAFMGHMAQHQAYLMQQQRAQAEAQRGQAPAAKSEQRGGPSEAKTVKSEAGAASQPARANDMLKPTGAGAKAQRMRQMQGEQTQPSG